MHIVVIDDEEILANSIQSKFQKQGYSVTTLMSYHDFLGFNTKQKIDLFLIDISLGDGSGINIIKNLKALPETSKIPIILISGHNDVSLKVTGLDAGADDYIVKPFQFDELFARVRSNMRKNYSDNVSSLISLGNINFDTSIRKVYVDTNEVSLSKKEKQILEYFLLHPEECISKTDLQSLFWKETREYSIPENTINVTICNLRKKLGNDFQLETIVGEGYFLKK